jgi:hypothetical protein
MPKHRKDNSREVLELIIVTTFVEVFLAREDHFFLRCAVYFWA